jgi:hypothetical protein
MPKGRGRGAPEIDLLEVMMMDEHFSNPIISTSLQVAPGVPDAKRPELGHDPNAVSINCERETFDFLLPAVTQKLLYHLADPDMVFSRDWRELYSQ